jgi:hypothetical protein
MMREDPIMYKELPAKHKQKYDEIKALFKADLRLFREDPPSWR